MARQEDDRLVLEKPYRINTRLEVRFDQVPVERSLVVELITERRESVDNCGARCLSLAGIPT